MSYYGITKLDNFAVVRANFADNGNAKYARTSTSSDEFVPFLLLRPEPFALDI
jgi:hypothetical protein